MQTLNTPRAFPQITSAAQWRERSRAVREQVLVSAGLWPMPAKTPLKAKIFGKIERDGYSVEKVYFESCPGFFVGGNLYRPTGRGAGPFPGILNPHGHWQKGRLQDDDLCSNAGRCINFARQGMIAFAYDMVGYNDTRFADSPRAANLYLPHNTFASNNLVATLWSVSLMGLQTWDSIRALDFLESLPDVDKTRLACTGESGGGTQTFILGAIDDRLAAQAPIVMVSHTMQGGCRCENMPGLRVRYSNMEVAAAAAPRPQILVSDTRDWTKTTLEMEGPAIMGVYQMFDGSQKLRYVRYDFEHNYNRTSREAVYQWFGEWLLHRPDEPTTEQAFQKETDSDLRVFPDGELPPNAIKQAELENYLIDGHRQRLAALDPSDWTKQFAYRQVIEPAWEHTLQLDWPLETRTSVRNSASREGCTAEELAIEAQGHTIKVVRFTPGKSDAKSSRPAVLLVDPNGGETFIDDAGNPRGLAQRLIADRQSVAVLADAGAPANPNQTDLLFTTYNRTRLQERVGDIVAACRALAEQGSRPPVLCGAGVAGLWCLLAAPAASAVAADCNQIRSSDDQELLTSDLFCPGLRNIDTFQGALILASPHPALLHNAGSDFDLDHARAAWKAVKSNNLRVEPAKLDDGRIASWISSMR